MTTGAVALMPEVLPDLDLVYAWQTVPRPTSAPGHRPGPGVDFTLWRLHIRYARSREATVRAELVEIYRGYAVNLARRQNRDGEPFEDLVQVAMEALLRSLDRFDPSRGIPFAAFATPTILGSLKRHYRDLGWSVRVPRMVHDIAAPARDASDRLTARLGRHPSIAEMAAELGIDEEALVATLQATAARSVTSLDAPLSDGERRGDLLGGEDAQFVLAENRVALQQAMKELSAQERSVLGMYYFQERPQAAIAVHYGVSQMQVSRWLSAALRRLRDRM